MRSPLYRQSRMPYSLSFLLSETALSIFFCSSRVKHSTRRSAILGRRSLSAAYSAVSPSRFAVRSEFCTTEITALALLADSPFPVLRFPLCKSSVTNRCRTSGISAPRARPLILPRMCCSAIRL